LSLITKRDPLGAQSCLKVIPHKVGVICQESPPEMSIPKMALRPSFAKLRNETVCPSGEISGVCASPLPPLPMRRRLPPSTSMIQIASSAVASS
jgi:hypothetical protein